MAANPKKPAPGDLNADIKTALDALAANGLQPVKGSIDFVSGFIGRADVKITFQQGEAEKDLFGREERKSK